MPVLQSYRESSDDESIDLANLSGREFLELAKENPEEDDSKWREILFVTWCFLTVSVDTLFLYIPIINEDMKCLMLDQKLKKTALILRSLTDLPYITLIVMGFGYKACHCFSLFYMLLITSNTYVWVTLAALPIPQIVILIFFPTIRGPRSLNGMKFLNSSILLQYVARAYPIYYFCKYFNKEKLDSKDKRWIPGVLNFTMYILASHVLGSFWYFFSIQRQLDCWIYSCRSENACEVTTFHCDKSTFTNITLLNDLCPINPPNATVFDFGIFLYALQSGLVGSTDFPQKFLQCFSWGLRNLSSFASNLNSSTYAWETLFVISIAISGLILFLYLLGHVQTFMQATRRTRKIRQKLKTIDPQIEFMVSEYGLPQAEWPILEIIEKRLEEEEDLVVENLFSLLPSQLKRHIKRHLFLATLKKVPGLEDIDKDKDVLNAILEQLQPVNYAGGSFIIREGEPLDMVIFITQGSVLTYNTCTGHGGGGSSSSSILKTGEVYGGELITWAATSASFSDLPPISPKTVRSHKKSHEKVEVFTLMASDLQHIVSEFPSFFNTELPRPMDTLVMITDGNL